MWFAVFLLSFLPACTGGIPTFEDMAGSTSDEDYCTPEREANFPFANSDEASADGLSDSTAFTICTTEQFSQIAVVSDRLSKVFKLMSDIDLNPSNGYNHIPIGTGTSPFSGRFYGNGYSISNLQFVSPAQSEVGLFGNITTSGHVERVRLVNAYVTGSNSVGLLAGVNFGTIARSSSSGAVSGSGNWIGGLVGSNKGVASPAPIPAIIEDCYSTANNTSSGNMVGGLAGLNSYSLIRRSYATGNVTTSGTGWQGNLVGYSVNTGNRVDDSFATGDILNTNAAPNSNVRMLIGFLASPGVTENSYYSGTCTLSGVCGSYGTYESDPSDFYFSSNRPLSNWDFFNIWKERTGDFPELR